MVELSRHIKVLLFENDCVIIPGLGGFIAHNRPAIYNQQTGSFMPPVRTIAFNPQLTANDGLLVQSYMQAYNTDFPDATRKIERLVTSIKEILYNDGRIELNEIGTIYYNINGVYQFEPFRNAFFAPQLYGLAEVYFPKLKMNVQQEQKVIAPQFGYTDSQNIIPRAVHSNRLINVVLRNAIAVAAAVILFFVLSIPVENTYVDDANYASLGSIGLFHSIRNHSAATSIVAQKGQKEKHQKRNNVNSLKPIAVRTEVVSRQTPNQAAAKTSASKVVSQPIAKTQAVPAVQCQPVAPATANKPSGSATRRPATISTPSSTHGSYIIISSLSTRKDAERILSQYKKEGCNNAFILEKDGRFRIAYDHYSSKKDAYAQATVLKKQNKFKNAWVLSLR